MLFRSYRRPLLKGRPSNRTHRAGVRRSGTAARVRCASSYSKGSTNRVSMVEDKIPPITTVANGRCTSAPVPVAIAIGKNPNEATSAVISTGRKRVSVPSRIASAKAWPCSLKLRIKLINTNPFSIYWIMS